jgi:hypothetical protein
VSRNESGRELSGRWFVVVLYVTVVAIAAGTGYFLGLFQPVGLDPRLFGVVQFPPTPLGMAAYGAITLATVLGVFFGGVAAVSRYYVDEGRDGAGAGTGTGTEPPDASESGDAAPGRSDR